MRFETAFWSSLFATLVFQAKHLQHGYYADRWPHSAIHHLCETPLCIFAVKPIKIRLLDEQIK